MGSCFLGCKLRGTGFIIEPETAAAWIKQDARCKDVLFPYLSGDDVNSEADLVAPRWAIDFGERTEAEAAQYTLPFSHVEKYVRPFRETSSTQALRRLWWRHERHASAMRQAIAGLDHTLVMAEVSSTIMPARVSTNQLFSHKLIVFATDSYADQAVLSSSAHWMWTVKHSVTMRVDPSYSPSVAFATFPRPRRTAQLEHSGRALEEVRLRIMLDRRLGLTKLYNLVHDSHLVDADDQDVAQLRRLHVDLDEAVMEASGWSDVPLEHGFHTYRQMERWTVSPAARVEILDRLLAENLRRAAVQPKAAAKATKGRARKTMEIDDAQGTLL